MSVDRLVMIYVPCSDEKEATTLGESLVREKLAACANILPGAKSIYMWEGKLTSDEEAILILKTTKERMQACKEAILKRHVYDTPCVEILSVLDASFGYTKWVIEQTT
jgi:periplasmic divalent cation tolerance protein